MYCSYIALELKYEFDLFQIQRLILLQLDRKTAKQLIWFLPLLEKSIKESLSDFLGKKEKKFMSNSQRW